MERIRVAHLVHCFGTGGLERGILKVVRRTGPEFEHSIVSLTAAGEISRELPPGVELVEMDKRAGNSFRFMWRLARVLRSLAPDVVHTRNWAGIDGLIAARLGRLRGLVHGEHGWEMGDVDGSRVRRRRIRRFVSRWIREITCVSRDIEGWLRESVKVRCPVVQIYNGVDTEVFRPAEDRPSLRASLGLEKAEFVVGIVARLDPIKDHATLFRAIDSLVAGRPALRLLVVGAGEERERLQAAAGPHVRFLGDRADVAELLPALDLFVLCSRNEGISNTILEAMATGLPVVATRVGGNPELVREGVTGRLVPVGDAESLANAIEEYVADPALRLAHGDAGRASVLERFSLDAMVAAYEAVWRRAAGRADGEAVS